MVGTAATDRRQLLNNVRRLDQNKCNHSSCFWQAIDLFHTNVSVRCIVFANHSGVRCHVTKSHGQHIMDIVLHDRTYSSHDFGLVVKILDLIFAWADGI